MTQVFVRTDNYESIGLFIKKPEFRANIQTGSTMIAEARLKHFVLSNSGLICYNGTEAQLKMKGR